MLTKLIWAMLLLFPSGDADRDDAWLGVVMVDVPKSLAAHLEGDAAGLMVINVVTDSPADKAGIGQYDVILRLDGKPVGEGADQLGKLVREHEPGDVVALDVFHKLGTKTIEVQLGERPKGETEYRYETPPDTWISDHLDLRGQILKKLPSGEWEVEQLGRLKDLPGFDFKPFEQFLPAPQTLQLEIAGEGKGAIVKAKQIDDDQVLTVETTDEGAIRVTREWEEDGEEYQKIEEYQDADALKEADEEAYELYQSVASGEGRARIDLRYSILGLPPHLEHVDKDVAEHVEKALREAQVQLKKAERGQEKGRSAYIDALRLYHQAPHALLWRGIAQDQRGFRFEIGEDDEIIVTFDGDDDEIVILFDGVEDLKEHSLELYSAFRKDQRGDEGEIEVLIEIEEDEDE